MNSFGSSSVSYLLALNTSPLILTYPYSTHALSPSSETDSNTNLYSSLFDI